ncbi:protein IQ-domain 1-like, partial [Trifolium medium]|nr:protein IQ-domain 1-like [Trifolium medium]
MGSGFWFKAIIKLRKSKDRTSKKAKGTLAPEKLSALKSNNYTGKESNGVENGIHNENLVPVETIAATRIQTAFRAYKPANANVGKKNSTTIERFHKTEDFNR